MRSVALLPKSAQTVKQIRKYNLRSFKLALPNYKNVPTRSREVSNRFFIPVNISFKLLGPKFCTRLGYDRVFTTVVPMPKAAIYKDTHFESWQYKVRLSRQIFAMEAKSIAMGMQKFPDNHLRLGVLPSNASHHARSRSTVNDVHLVPLPPNSVVS